MTQAKQISSELIMPNPYWSLKPKHFLLAPKKMSDFFLMACYCL